MNASVVLKDYIREELMNGANSELDESENLLAAGIIDSWVFSALFRLSKKNSALKYLTKT